ncbi:MAG: cupin domain-containing protein [Thermoleophilaceae bacterium]
MTNIERPDYQDPSGRPEGFRVRRARLGDAVGARRLGASVWELPPGEAAYPYHYHLAEEELIVVLEGRPSLRTPDGWRELEQGEVVSFPVGEEGGHQLANRTDALVRFLSISTSGVPEICVYPDSGKIGAYGRTDEELRELHRRSDAVDYWEGERPPER